MSVYNDNQYKKKMEEEIITFSLLSFAWGIMFLCYKIIGMFIYDMIVTVIGIGLFFLRKKNVYDKISSFCVSGLYMLHQVLTVFMVGDVLGLQYVLLFLEPPSYSSTQDADSVNRYFLIARFSGIAIFCTLILSLKTGLIVPKYVLTGTSTYVITAVAIMLSAVKIVFNAVSNVISDRKFLETQRRIIEEAANEKIAISEALLAEEQAKNEALRANEKKSLFLANMSHEIRTPINVILGMNSMVLRDEDNPEILDYAREIDVAGKNLLGLISDVLDLSKIESGELEIVHEPFESAEFVKSIIGTLEERVKPNSLKAYEEIDSDIPAVLVGDVLKITQIINNFVGNACKYTKAGSVSLYMNWDSSGALVVRVSDTGIGMTKESIDHIFDKFSRFDSKRNEYVEGAGLGMPIAKELANAMGCTIDIQSEIDHGTTATIVIPLEAQGDELIDLTGKKNADNKRTNTSFVAEECSVMMVDDTAANLKLLRAFLMDTKLNMKLSTTGKGAIDLCNKFKFDLLLIDHMMPEVDGIDVLKAVRSEGLNKDTPAIVLTANAMSTSREYYLGEGFDDYISKPINLGELDAMIIKYLPKEKVTVTVR